MDDLKDTDIYVFRESTGELLDHQSGLPDSAISQSDGKAYFQIVMPGPDAGNATANGNDEAFQQQAGESATVIGKNVDSIRPREALEVVVINKATGYIGTLQTAASAAGTVAPIALHEKDRTPITLDCVMDVSVRSELKTKSTD